MGRYTKRKNGAFVFPRLDNRALLALCAGAALLILCLALVLFLPRSKQEQVQKIGSITVAGVSLQGMTEEEAVVALHSATDKTYPLLDMTVQVGPEEKLVIPASQVNVRLDIDGAVKAALAYSRQSQGEPFDAEPYFRLDLLALRNAIRDFSKELSQKAIPTTYQVLGNTPDLTQSTGEEQILMIQMGTPCTQVEEDTLYRQILQAYYSNSFHLQVDGKITSLPPLDLERIYQETYIAPVDAAVDPATQAVTPERYGYSFDLTDAQRQLATARQGDILLIPFARIAPGITSENLASGQFQDVLASYRTPHTQDSDRNTNLRLACEAINGMVIAPGETFSYNEALGPRTADRGYKPAESYVNGMTVDTLGGGICQVSSTLYYCTMVSDLKTVERYAHSYVPSYMPKGTDAAVSWGTKDFRFRNSTHSPIRIEAWMADGFVNVRLIGTEEKDYYVKVNYEEISHSDATTVYQEMPADNPQGYRDGDVIVTPYDGSTVKTYKFYYDRNTDELISSNYVDTSRYRVRNEVVCRIVTPTEPETAPPTEPETTPPTVPETSPPTVPETTPPTVPETTPPTVPETIPPTEPETTPPTEPEATPPTVP